ncbi:hypothetical protein DFJ74DRAFT_654815 [Hyaloraphidium curvatum]|nr:hypothetical protein DFJ74DRAFT_654815 [Hyaloraphidium curvatum]
MHALVFLSTHWSVTAKAWMTCLTTVDPLRAKLIRVIPHRHHGSGALCEIETQTIPDEETGEPRERRYFVFQKRKFFYDDAKRAFVKLQYPSSKSYPLKHFYESSGIATQGEWKLALAKFGANFFDIPIPTFQELFQQHMVAPFFVFQLFCVALWFLDEMWYYSVFTLIMLFVFESTVVMQRLQSLREMRNMSIKPYRIYTRRGKRWVIEDTDKLVPGDLVSVGRSKEDCPVPCDMLLLDGSAIANEAMLSGESTPLLKESIAMRDLKDEFDERGTDKLHLLYGGTKVLQVTPPTAKTDLAAPDGGALCYVLRTGFGTTQGKLVRTIIYSTERVTANNLEAFVFILFLLVFAVMASAYVWVEGTKNELRKRSKIMLDCVLIITSVVPPELPMELSLAVNNALIALMRAFVFCTEPFRIPFAGKLDILAFDKTGTLTDTNLVVEGLGGIEGDSMALMSPREAPLETTITLAAAHALVLVDDGVIGDPMEKTTLEAINWAVGKNDVVLPRAAAKGSEGGKIGSGRGSIRILRRFQFSSALKRMSAIASYSDLSGNTFQFVAVKGAPETLKGMIENVPPGYDAMYKHWAKEGSRVLALGFKKLPKARTGPEIRDASRDSVESRLDFAGFLVFHCPLKKDSVDAIRKLNESSHRTIMITGDNALTACHVAKQVGIAPKPALILDNRAGDLSWQDLEETVSIPCNPKSRTLDPALDDHSLCITGAALASLEGTAMYAALLPRIWVYARVSPTQKELIINALNHAGYMTLMCGDGTNDVGALKQAHVGVALLEGKREDVERQGEIARQRRAHEMQDKQRQFASRFGVRMPDQNGGTAVAANGKPKDPRVERHERAAEQMQDSVNRLLDEMEAEVPMVKFGDASVASPFTSKISSIMSVRDIVRQGRATLVAMLQMYKILALNCIISAYSMSVLYLAGIKQGDWQATIAGVLLTVCFFAIARSTPLEELSKQRPQPSIFNLYFFLSVLGQSAVHVAALAYIRSEAIKYSEVLDENINLDAEFSPNLLNTAVYLISLTMQIATFAVNYQGRPFRESLTENKPLWLSIRIVGSIAVTSALQVLPFINDWMQLVGMPVPFQRQLLAAMALDIALAWIVEDTMRTFLSDAKPRPSLMLET